MPFHIPDRTLGAQILKAPFVNQASSKPTDGRRYCITVVPRLVIRYRGKLHNASEENVSTPSAQNDEHGVPRTPGIPEFFKF
jgi:hypothetical protein